MIFSGIAGNLNTNLHINDVVLGGTLRYLDTDMRLVGQFKPGTADRPIEEYHSDDRLLELADQALNDLNIHHIVGIIATGNYFVDASAEGRAGASVRPARTRWKWKAPPSRMSPPATTFPHW